MSTRHRWFDEITAWAERGPEAIQCQRVAADHVPGWEDKWSDHYPSDSHGTPAWNNPHYRWRIKPRMCSLYGHEFPAPERDEPDLGAQCFFPISNHVDLWSRFSWLGDDDDFMMLRRARVHLSKDAAIAHARAEILAVGGTLEDE